VKFPSIVVFMVVVVVVDVEVLVVVVVVGFERPLSGRGPESHGFMSSLAKHCQCQLVPLPLAHASLPPVVISLTEDPVPQSFRETSWGQRAFCQP
jgi:hypothetical protein